MCGACSKNNTVISVRIYDTGYGLKQLKLLFFGGLERLSLELNQIIINHGFQAHFIRAIKFKLPNIKKSTFSRISKMPIFLFLIIWQQRLTNWQECDIMYLVSKGGTIYGKGIRSKNLKCYTNKRHFSKRVSGNDRGYRGSYFKICIR